METKDIYTNAPGDGMETKQTPGYVPAPTVNPDVVQPAAEEAPAEETVTDEKTGGTTAKKTGGATAKSTDK